MRVLQIRVVVMGCVLSTVVANGQGEPLSRAKLADVKQRLFEDQSISPERREEMRKRVDEIGDLVRAEAVRSLNAGIEKPGELARHLRPIIEDDPADPVSVIAKQVNGTNIVVVAYSVRSGAWALPSFRAFIEGFRKTGSLYEAVARAGEDLDESQTRLEELPSPWPTELWLLAHGQQAKVMQYHEKLAIYSFDGSIFKELWTPTSPLKAPTFQITENSLRITSEDEQGSGPLLVKTIGLTQAGAVEIGTLPKN